VHLEGGGPIWTRQPAGDALARFEERHARLTEVVRRAFADLFRSRRAQTVGLEAAAARDLFDDLDAPDLAARLTAQGFRDPEAAAIALRQIRDGAGPSRTGNRRDALALAPALLTAVRESAAPDRALAQLAEFLARVGARRTFLALLAENPATLRLLVRLFATSEYLTRALLQHPELLDTLVRSDLAVVEKSAAQFAAELDGLLRQAVDVEERLDLLRRYRNDEALRIGIHDIEGELHYSKVSDQLSELADACLHAAYELALAERAARYGVPAGQHLAVLALGKLGSCELNYHSDLDLIFVYGAVPGAAPSPEEVGRFEASGLGAHEFFSKLAQLFMLILQLGTREGIAYKIDTRLRPSGRSGSLVTSLDGFARYHATSSAVWERQALVRARVVCGPPELRAQVEQIVERFVYGRGLSDAELAEIARLRARMERELAREDAQTFNLKMGRGGLVDVEFIAQAAALAHGHEMPELRERGTRRLLDAMGAVGLLGAAEHETLLRAYSFLRGLENRLRIEGEHPIERVRRDPAALIGAARRMGFTEAGVRAGELLLAEYDRHREAVREIYTRRVGRFAAE
jgi:glutamate-ammonia-ligase adenylyltransferase